MHKHSEGLCPSDVDAHLRVHAYCPPSHTHTYMYDTCKHLQARTGTLAYANMSIYEHTRMHARTHFCLPVPRLHPCMHASNAHNHLLSPILV
jgi:hypothetical protein